ncbi:MAG: transposase [Geminicoccaceae bacterium]|nr:transposase [Geminicoccaceae bacterium]
MKGRKRQLLVDTLGSPIAWRVKPANMSDRKDGRYLISGLAPLWPRIKTVIADAGYESKKLGKFIKDHAGWTLKIVKRVTPEFAIIGLNWIVKRTFAWLGRERRL